MEFVLAKTTGHLLCIERAILVKEAPLGIHSSKGDPTPKGNLPYSHFGDRYFEQLPSELLLGNIVKHVAIRVHGLRFEVRPWRNSEGRILVGPWAKLIGAALTQPSRIPVHSMSLFVLQW